MHQGDGNFTMLNKSTVFCRCKWEGKKCEDFSYKNIITDFGLCVQFNVSSVLTNKTGAGFGLSLTLNIEQYEYVNGPTTDAGIKVICHSEIGITLTYLFLSLVISSVAFIFSTILLKKYHLSFIVIE